MLKTLLIGLFALFALSLFFWSYGAILIFKIMKEQLGYKKALVKTVVYGLSSLLIYPEVVVDSAKMMVDKEYREVSKNLLRNYFKKEQK